MVLCTEKQRQAIRALLPRAGKTESWLLAKLQVKSLDELLSARAELAIFDAGDAEASCIDDFMIAYDG
jgi:hypothetical protein